MGVPAARQGFTNLYTLEGGVHAYLRWQGEAPAAAAAREEARDPLWRGSLFVFDNRLAVAPPGAQRAAEPTPDNGRSALRYPACPCVAQLSGHLALRQAARVARAFRHCQTPQCGVCRAIPLNRPGQIHVFACLAPARHEDGVHLLL
jgi:predicted sulfurtransferase